MPGNKHTYPVIIVMGTLLCLAGLSILPNGFTIGSHTLRPLDILADLREQPPAPEDDTTGTIMQSPLATNGPDSLSVLPPAIRHNYLTYTGILDYGAYADTLGRSSGMRHFTSALKALRAGQRRKVRIAYFGDSMIEGDLITMDLRDSLQAYFGGEGVGFVPATSVVSGFRTTIGHTYSPNWTDYHFRNEPPKGTSLGISGHVFMPKNASWVRYTPVRHQRLDQFEEVSLLYGSGEGNIDVNGQPIHLQGHQIINEYLFKSDSATRALTVTFNNTAPFYGVCFESNAGVFLDNYSFRGISGIELGKLSRDVWEDMQAVHPYDLIVLHYGANVLSMPENTKYDWYERPMSKVVDSLRSLFPETSILLIGTADKAYKKAGKYITAPGVKALMKVQHSMAESRRMAYWNLYTAMGGDGAMARWVEGDTTFANKDYTHFNPRGAARVGSLLYKAIMDEYQQERN